ncbi:uncharacterized protein [Hetaerina americana]|uniref:uncharacterized protein n=1 Tax=Hetaerina americana TaxID=62018 RepID=UPI003A7F31C7
MMEMEAGAAATTSNEEEDGQCARRPAKGEMDQKQGGGSSREPPTLGKSDAGGNTKLTEPAKHSTVVVQSTAKPIECQDVSQIKKTDPCHSKTTAQIDSSDGKKLSATIGRTSQLETLARAPEPAKSLTLPDKVSSSFVLPSTKITIPSSSVPANLPGPSSEVPSKPATTCPSLAKDATKTSISNVSSSTSGNVPALPGRTVECRSSDAQSSSKNPPCHSLSTESVVTPAVTSKPAGDKLPTKVLPSSSHLKPAGASTTVSAANNSGLCEKSTGKTEAISKTSSLVQTAPKIHVSQPATTLPSSSSKPILSRSPTVSSPVVSSSTSSKPAVASTIVTKSPAPSVLPTVTHSSRNVPSSTSCSTTSSSSMPSKTSQSHGPPFKPIPKIPPVMPSVKPKINPPKFSSLVSSSSMQKPSTTQASTSAASTSNVPKSPVPLAPKPSTQTTGRPSLSPNIRPLMSIKVACPSSFTSSRTSLQYSSHSPFSSGSRAAHMVSSPVVTSSQTSVTTTSPRAVLSSSPHRAPIGSPRTPSQPVHSTPGAHRSTSSSQSMSSSAGNSLPSRSPALPARQSSSQQSPQEPSRPSSTSRASEPQATPSLRREDERTPAQPATDFSVPDVRRDCPAGPNPATPSASLVPDVLRTGSEEEDRHLERMLRPTPFGPGIPPPHIPDLCRRGGETSVAPTRPILPSSAEADLDLLKPAAAGGNPQPRTNDVAIVEHHQPQAADVEPMASAPTGRNEEPRSNENQTSQGEGNQSANEELRAVSSCGENIGEAVVNVDGAVKENSSGDSSNLKMSAHKAGSSPKDSIDGENESSGVQASGSEASSTQKKEETPAESEKPKGDGERLEKGVRSEEKTISDPKEGGSDKGVKSVKSDSAASSTSESASCDAEILKERTRVESSPISKSSLPLEKAAAQQSSDSSGVSDKCLIATPSNKPPEQPSSSSKGERMTVEKAEAEKDSLIGEENNSSLMIPPPSASLPKVLVMGDEAKGREGDQPQKEGKEVVAKEEEKQVKEVLTSTNGSGSKTVKSRAECDKPVTSDEDKLVTKLLDNISPKPPKDESAAPSSEASPACEGGIVPAKDCDALGSDKVGKKIAILQSEASQESVSLPLPVVKNIDKSSNSSKKSSLDISVSLVGKSSDKALVTSESMDPKVSKNEKDSVQLKTVSCRDSSGVLKEIDHKADLNSHKVKEVICKGNDKELLSKDNKESVVGETRKTLDSISHDKSVQQAEPKKLVVDCHSHIILKKDAESEKIAIQATGDKAVQKSACVEQKSVTKSCMPTSKGLCHSEGKLKAFETPAILTKEDTKPSNSGC